jgi:hypothetical protein
MALIRLRQATSEEWSNYAAARPGVKHCPITNEGEKYVLEQICLYEASQISVMSNANCLVYVL